MKATSRFKGFTLIEIVIALLLLGIVSAVAVTKYFDFQDDAQLKVCRHNRSAVIEAILNREALARVADDASIFDHENGQKQSEEITAQMGGAGCVYGKPCENHCPAGGRFIVHYTEIADIPVVTVSCDKHNEGSSSSTPSTSEGGAFLGKTEADLYEWLRKSYDTVLDKFFTEGPGRPGSRYNVIDSNVDYVKNNPQLSVEAIRQSLAGEGFDLTNSVFCITREDNGFYDAQGVYQGINNPPKGKLWHWRATITISIASLPADVKPGDTIIGKTYTMTLDYHDKYSANERDVEKYGALQPVNDRDGETEFIVSQDSQGALIIRKK